MSDQLPMKPSELKSFLKFEGSYNYSLKRFIDVGHFRAALLLQDNVLNEDVLGRIVGDYNEGEFVQWPHLRHENLILLLDMIPLSHQKTIFIFTFIEKTLRTVVRDANFKFHPKSFDRKRSYAKDVLSGLEYLHQKSVSLMNLNDENVLICSQTDKAVISDLSCSVSKIATTKANCPVMLAKHLPPEVDDGGEFECQPFDMWNCGIMFLQMFTRHALPWCQDLKTDYLEGLTTELLRRENPGSKLKDCTANDLKDFLSPFLQKDPLLRISAKAALTSVFLRSSGKRIDEEARDFWKACETEKLMSDGKFGDVRIYHGTRDIYGKRTDTNSTADGMLHYTDIKLKKSKSSNELNAISRKSSSEINLFSKVTSKNRSYGTFLPQNSLLKRTSYSEENLGNIFSRIYDNTPRIDGSDDAKKAEDREVKPVVKTKDEILTTMPEANEEIARNLNSEDSSKFYAKEKYSEKSNFTFDLPCHCVFCTGTLYLASPMKFIQSWPLPDMTTKDNAHSSEQKSAVFPSQTQGGFLHNNWKNERKYSVTDRSCHDPVKDSSTKQLNEKGLKNFRNMEHTKTSDKLAVQNTNPVNLFWCRWIEDHRIDSDMPARKVYPDNSFTSGENQLMFQRCTGFRNGKIEQKSKYRTPHPHPPPTVITRTQLPSSQDEGKTSRESQLESDRRTKDSATSDGNCLKKGKKSTKKIGADVKQNGTDSKAVMTARSDENKVVDISMELPLCSESAEKRKPNKGAFRDKQKQKWIRVLCPGSVLEEKTVAQEIGNDK